MPVVPTFPDRPKVIFWFRVYAGLMTVIYVLLAASSLIFFLADPADLDTSKEGARLLGIVFLILGAVLAGVFFLPFIARPEPWLWIYDLVLICIGMTSACVLPVCIVLLIFWIKPETKAHFGRQ